MGSIGTHWGLGLYLIVRRRRDLTKQKDWIIQAEKSAFQTAKGTSQGKEVRVCVEFGGHQLAGAVGWC